MTPTAISQTPTLNHGKGPWLPSGRNWTGATVIGTALMTLLMLCLPSKSPTTGKQSEVTFALGWQDQPPGIYLDRQFDWPTGEAVWIDVPVLALQVASVVVLVNHLRSAGR